MQRNGFYAAMKTDEGVQAIYIDEGSLRAQQERAAFERQGQETKLRRRKERAALTREKRGAVRVLKQALKLLGMEAVLYFGLNGGLVDPDFAVPVLVAFQTLLCFRIGRWFGRQDCKEKRGN